MKIRLEEKLKFLGTMSSYPEKTNSLEVKETHASWVFLTDHFVYKLKKPVRFSYFDHTTLGARRKSAKAEIEINQEMAPGIYLGVEPLIALSRGELKLGEDAVGQVVDWLVKMRRIPKQTMLDAAIAGNDFSMERVSAAALELAEFYQRGKRIDISPRAYKQTLSLNIQEAFDVLISPRYGLNPAKVNAVFSEQKSCLKELDGLINKRVEEGRIVEGHGDLRPEHICLTDPPVIIDRIEFDQKLRWVDPADELSFLAVELLLLGRADLSGVFFSKYRKVCGDEIEEELIQFYQSYRGCLRAKLSAWHLDDPAVEDKVKWQNKAYDYLNLAAGVLGEKLHNGPTSMDPGDRLRE